METLVVVAAAKPDDFTNTVETCARQIGSSPGRGKIHESTTYVLCLKGRLGGIDYYGLRYELVRAVEVGRKE